MNENANLILTENILSRPTLSVRLGMVCEFACLGN